MFRVLIFPLNAGSFKGESLRDSLFFSLLSVIRSGAKSHSQVRQAELHLKLLHIRKSGGGLAPIGAKLRSPAGLSSGRSEMFDVIKTVSP